MNHSTSDRLAVPLWGLFILAVLYTAHFAALFIAPIAVAVVITMILAPLLNGLTRVGIPRSLGAFAIVLLLVVGFVGTIVALSAPAQTWLERAPQLLQNLDQSIDQLRTEVSNVKQTSASMERLANIAEPSPRDSITVDVRQPSLFERILSSTPGFLGVVGATTFLIFFFLALGDRSLKAFAGAWRDERTRANILRVAAESQRAISRYLATISVINLILGAASACLFYALDLPNPLLWGAMVAIFNFAPYLGAAVSSCVIALVAVTTFGLTSQALWPPLLFVLLTTLEGQVITPMIVGEELSLNPLLVFVAILGLGALWGVIGALIAIPLLVSFAIASMHMDNLKPLAGLVRLKGRVAHES